MGQRVETLADGFFEAGNYTFTWDASAYPSGLYLYRMKADTEIFTRKMLLLK